MVKIITDSASDIPHNIAFNLDISVVPARILFGREVYLDGVDLQTNDFYNKLKTHRYHPLTTQASPLAFYRVIKKIEQSEEDILIITLPLSVSKFRESAEIAVKFTSSVNYHIFDSTGISMYQGLVVIQAARLAKMGYSLNAIIDKLNQITPNTILFAVAETFDYLIRGGRVPLSKGKLGSILGITPLLEVNDSKTEAVDTPKGLKKGIEMIIDRFKIHYQHFDQDQPFICSVMHSMNPSYAANLNNEILNNFNIIDLIPAKIGPTIGAHVGPGAIGAAMSPAIPELVQSTEITRY